MNKTIILCRSRKLRAVFWSSVIFSILAQTPIQAGYSDYRITNVWDKTSAVYNQKLSIVLDLDNTLVLVSKKLNHDGIDLGDLGKYNLTHGATEFLVALSRLPNVEISFFSAGLEQRNRALIMELLDLVWQKHEVLILPKIFSRQHLSHVRSFHGEKKDLKILGGSIDLMRVILVDDNPRWVMPGQEDNWVGVNSGTSGYSGASVSSGASGYSDTSGFIMDSDSDKTFLASNKLIPALGIIALAVENSIEQNGSPIGALKALKALESDREFHFTSLAANRFYFERGLQEVRRLNPTFELAGDSKQLNLLLSKH